MPPAESISEQKITQVHPGADTVSAKRQVVGFVSHALSVRVLDECPSKEWNRGSIRLLG